MIYQHPAIARAAALRDRFWAHAPQPAAPVADPEVEVAIETETTPATQLEVETLFAEQEYLEFDAYLTANPHEASEGALERVGDLYADWQCLLAAVPSFTVTTQPHESHGTRGVITRRNFSDRAQAQAYAAFFGRSTIVKRNIVPCAECGGHGCDGPKRIHWTNPNNIALRCGRCGGDGEEPELADTDEDRYPDNDPSL